MYFGPDNPREIEQFILDDVLHGIELQPRESLALLSYMRERHGHHIGPFETYFVLGSYERPFKYRLEVALTELNNRLHAYAYLMAPQPDPDLPDRLPELKIKFYLHAIHADWIVLVLEHNTGGAVAEFGRVDRPFLFDRTNVFPRGYDALYPDTPDSIEGVHARSIELAYRAEDEAALLDSLESLESEATAEEIPVTIDELTEYLEGELGGRTVPSYSGVISDGLTHYERRGRCFSWTTEGDLRSAIQLLP